MATFMIFLPIIIVSDYGNFRGIFLVNFSVFFGLRKLSGVGGIVGGIFIISEMIEYQGFFDSKVILMPIAMLLSSVIVLGASLVGCAGVIKESSVLLMSVRSH
jgi:hypothetical protein